MYLALKKADYKKIWDFVDYNSALRMYGSKSAYACIVADDTSHTDIRRFAVIEDIAT